MNKEESNGWSIFKLQELLKTRKDTYHLVLDINIDIHKRLLNKDRLEVICQKDGYVWEASVNNLITGKVGCKRCRVRKQTRTYDYVKEVIEETRNIRILTPRNEYEKASKKGRFQCTNNNCHYIWETTYQSIINGGKGCKVCATKNRRTSFEKVKERINDFGKFVVISPEEEYKNQRSLITVKCVDCGSETTKQAFRVLENKGCRPCANKKMCEGRYNLIIADRNRDTWKNRDQTLYVLKCFDENEAFIKIGITGNKIARRYDSKKKLPYKYKVLYTIESNKYHMFYLEYLLHTLYRRDYAYQPKNRFNGDKECYTQAPNIEQYLSLSFDDVYSLL